MKAPQSWFTTLLLAIAIVPIGAISANTPAAEASTPLFRQPLVIARYVPPSPPSRSAPGTIRGAASRGCLLLAKNSREQGLNSLLALVPETQGKQGTEVWGYTAVERPTFWFYVPYQSTSIAEIEFVLNDDQDKTLHKFPVSVPSEAGIIRFQLPATAALQPGKMYNWFLKVRTKSSACSPGDAANAATPDSATDVPDLHPPVYVEGWVQYVPPAAALTSRLQPASLQQQAALYGEHGYWYDALTAIATAHQAQPSDTAIAADWAALLQQVKLEKLVNQPLVECCKEL